MCRNPKAATAAAMVIHFTAEGRHCRLQKRYLSNSFTGRIKGCSRKVPGGTLKLRESMLTSIGNLYEIK